MQQLSRADIDSTVAAVFRQPAYHDESGLAKTLWRKLWDFIIDLVNQAIQEASRLPHAVIIARALLIIIALLIIGFVGYKLYSNRRNKEHGVDFSGAERKQWSNPWLMAQRLAAEGKYTDAAHHLYAELLRRTARSGHIVLHVSKTSGDYVRELRPRAKGEHTQAFSEFVRVYETSVYGVGSCSADDYNRLVDLAAPFIANHG